MADIAELLGRLMAGFNAHDVEGLVAMFAEDGVMEMPRGPDPWGTRFVGRAAIREGLKARFAGIPDVHYGEDDHHIAGDMGMSRWLLTGTVAATGQRIAVRGCDFYTFRDGLVVRKDSYWKIVEPAPR
jgi:ketosteroid isomerase-like protein